MIADVAVVLDPAAITPEVAADRAVLGAVCADMRMSVGDVTLDDTVTELTSVILLAHPRIGFDAEDELIEWVDENGAIAEPLNSYGHISWNLHRRCLFDLAAAGIPLVPTQSLAQDVPFAFQRAVLRRFDGDVVIQPALRLGPSTVGRFPADSTDAFAHAEALCLLGDVIVQAAPPDGAERAALIVIDGAVTHVERTGPSGEARSDTPTVEEIDVVADLVRLIVDEAQQTPAFLRVDLVDLAGPTVIDVDLVTPDLLLRRSEATAQRLAEVIAGFVCP